MQQLVNANCTPVQNPQNDPVYTANDRPGTPAVNSSFEYSWSLWEVLSCAFSVPASADVSVTVEKWTGNTESPEQPLSYDQMIDPSDGWFNAPSGFTGYLQNALPLFLASGPTDEATESSYLEYFRPWEGGSDQNQNDAVLADGLVTEQAPPAHSPTDEIVIDVRAPSDKLIIPNVPLSVSGTTVSFNAPDTITDQNGDQISADAPGLVWTWTFSGASSTLNGTSGSYTYSEPGNYSLSVTVENTSDGLTGQFTEPVPPLSPDPGGTSTSGGTNGSSAGSVPNGANNSKGQTPGAPATTLPEVSVTVPTLTNPQTSSTIAKHTTPKQAPAKHKKPSTAATPQTVSTTPTSKRPGAAQTHTTPGAGPTRKTKPKPKPKPTHKHKHPAALTQPGAVGGGGGGGGSASGLGGGSQGGPGANGVSSAGASAGLSGTRITGGSPAKTAHSGALQNTGTPTANNKVATGRKPSPPRRSRTKHQQSLTGVLVGASAPLVVASGGSTPRIGRSAEAGSPSARARKPSPLEISADAIALLGVIALIGGGVGKELRSGRRARAPRSSWWRSAAGT